VAGPGPEAAPPRSQDLLAALLGVAALGLAAGAPWLVDRSGPDPFYKGPLIFPLIALLVMAAGALPALARLTAGGTRFGLGRLRRRTLALFALMCGFPPALAAVGVEAASFCFVLAGLWIAGYRRPGIALATAAGVTLALHLAFVRLLDIWFPTPLLLELIGSG